MSSSGEKLYCIKYHRERDTNEVDDTRIYRRIKREDFQSLSGIKYKKISGSSKSFLKIRCEIDQLLKNGKEYGFRIRKHNSSQKIDMYFEFEEKKGG